MPGLRYCHRSATRNGRGQGRVFGRLPEIALTKTVIGWRIMNADIARDDEAEGGEVEISACENADKQGAEDEYPRAVVLRDGDLFFEVFSHG